MTKFLEKWPSESHFLDEDLKTLHRLFRECLNYCEHVNVAACFLKLLMIRMPIFLNSFLICK